MTVELITASQALKLATPSRQEGLDRYKGMVADLITESAMGQVKSITMAVPTEYSGSIQLWLTEHEYETSVTPDDMEYWSVIEINWGKANEPF